jgi:hypothetical protein
MILSQKNNPPTTKHDVGEDIEFHGTFLEAELVGDIAVAEGNSFTLLSATEETRVWVKSCRPLPEGSAFFQVKVSAA